MKIILASNSPRRKILLKRLGLQFKVVPADIDETQISTKIKPKKYCILLAKLKTEKISFKYPKSLILCADTIVVIKNKILNKPRNKNEAQEMLNSLSNNLHEVHTGVCIINIEKNIYHSFCDTSKVEFNKLTEEEISYYIENFKPFDKAGAYGIQDWSSVFVKKINGCYDNIVGLPISKLYHELKKINTNLLDSILKKS